MIPTLATCLAFALVALVVVALNLIRALARLDAVDRDRCEARAELSNANLRLRLINEQRKQRAQRRAESRRRQGGKRRKGGKGMMK